LAASDGSICFDATKQLKVWSSDAAIRRLPPRRSALAIGREAFEVIPGLIDGIIILTPVDGKKGARKDNTASMSLKCHQRTSK